MTTTLDETEVPERRHRQAGAPGNEGATRGRTAVLAAALGSPVAILVTWRC